MAAPEVANVAIQIAVATPVDTDATMASAGGNLRQPEAGFPIVLHPNDDAGGNPTQGSPTKQQLREEVQQLKEHHHETMQAAEQAIAEQQDRARRALHYQDTQFRQAASEFEQEARDVQEIEVAQTRARIAGEASQAVRVAEHRAGQEARQYATRITGEAEHYVEGQRDYIIQEAQNALEQERIQSANLLAELPLRNQMMEEHAEGNFRQLQ